MSNSITLDRRECVVCGKEIDWRRNGNAKTCSVECSKKRRRETMAMYSKTDAFRESQKKYKASPKRQAALERAKKKGGSV